MRRLSVMVSCAEDANHWRDIAEDVQKRLQHSYLHELGRPYFLEGWDYRIASPTVVPRGELASPSLAAVDQSEALLVIVNERIGEVTRKEVLRAFERRANGDPVKVLVYLKAGGNVEALKVLAAELLERYSEQIVWTTFDGDLDFQGRVFCCLNEELIRGSGEDGAMTPESR